MENKEVGQKQSRKFQHLLSKAFESIIDYVMDFVPSNTVKELHPYFAYSIGGFMIAVLLGAFLAILITGYQTEISQKYLSPVGNGDSTLCNSVTISNSGDYLLSKEGYWEGSSDFSYNTAMYQISILNTELSSSDYSNWIDYFKATTNFYGEIGYYVDLGDNLMIWMALVMVSPDSTSSRFFMNADPSVIFNRPYISGTITSQSGTCQFVGTASFDQANNLLKMSFPISDYYDNYCYNYLDPSLFGYVYDFSPYSFDFQVDIRSLISAVAVNIKVNGGDTSYLDRVYDSEIVTNHFNNMTMAFAKFVDPRYEGMDPIFCGEDSFFPYCVLVYGDVYVLPIFIHIGASIEYPTHCNCSDPDLQSSSTDSYFFCNSFSFFVGFLFYPTSDPAPLVDLLLTYSYTDIQYLALSPMFAGSVLANETLSTDSGKREEFFSFCYSETYGSCRFAIWTMFNDLDDLDYSVSSYYDPVKNGACNDIFSMSDAAW
jgi:FlaG/FlaF family flagellin (archaellin)